MSILPIMAGVILSGILFASVAAVVASKQGLSSDKCEREANFAFMVGAVLGFMTWLCYGLASPANEAVAFTNVGLTPLWVCPLGSSLLFGIVSLPTLLGKLISKRR